MTKEPKLNLRNWECGVVVPFATETQMGIGKSLDRADRVKGFPDKDVFTGSVPVPMDVPGEHYRERRPWFFSEV